MLVHMLKESLSGQIILRSVTQERSRQAFNAITIRKIPLI